MNVDFGGIDWWEGEIFFFRGEQSIKIATRARIIFKYKREEKKLKKKRINYVYQKENNKTVILWLKMTT